MVLALQHMSTNVYLFGKLPSGNHLYFLLFFSFVWENNVCMFKKMAIFRLASNSKLVMQICLADCGNILKNLKNHNLRPTLWQNSSQMGLGPKIVELWRFWRIPFKCLMKQGSNLQETHRQMFESTRLCQALTSKTSCIHSKIMPINIWHRL